MSSWAHKRGWILQMTYEGCGRPTVHPFLFPSMLGCEGRAPILQDALQNSQCKHKNDGGWGKSLQGQDWGHVGAESWFWHKNPGAVSSLSCSCPSVTGWQCCVFGGHLLFFKEKKITADKVVHMKMGHYLLKIYLTVTVTGAFIPLEKKITNWASVSSQHGLKQPWYYFLPSLFGLVNFKVWDMFQWRDVI